MGDFFEVSLPSPESLTSKAEAGLMLLDLRDQMKLGVSRIVQYSISKASGVCFSTGGSKAAGHKSFGEPWSWCKRPQSLYGPVSMCPDHSPRLGR